METLYTEEDIPAIGEQLEKVLRRLKRGLDREHLPGICTHHGECVGISLGTDRLLVGACPGLGVGVPGDTTTITVYGSKVHTDMSAAVLDEIDHQVMLLWGAWLKRWNGEPGQDGVSYQVNQTCFGMAEAVRRYHAIKNVFKLTKEESQGFRDFDRAWREEVRDGRESDGRNAA